MKQYKYRPFVLESIVYYLGPENAPDFFLSNIHRKTSRCATRKKRIGHQLGMAYKVSGIVYLEQVPSSLKKHRYIHAI